MEKSLDWKGDWPGYIERTILRALNKHSGEAKWLSSQTVCLRGGTVKDQHYHITLEVRHCAYEHSEPS